MPDDGSFRDACGIAGDIWAWIQDFVSVPNEFYGGKFAPCPYAQQALARASVDVVVWRSGDLRRWIRDQAESMRDTPSLTTRVMVFPPAKRWAWRLTEYVETLNSQLVASNVFLNTGVAKTTRSRYPGSSGEPYFIVVANSLDAVLRGAEALRRTDYYRDWPKSHYELVVNRRARLAGRYSDT